jgi:N-acyl-D-aspartate/D-glutamate deacylase
MSFDVVIRNGTLIDGTGARPIRADLAIVGERIAAIGEVDARGLTELDADGKYVTPGFIDIHSHSDYTLLVDPRAVSAIRQGVTLEVIGNCGFGCAPIRDPSLAKGSIYGFDGSIPLAWRSMGEYLERLDAAAPAVNVITLVPNAQLRLSTVGMHDRPADRDELARMKDLLSEGLGEGAFGYSTGLEYGAERGAGEAELSELCRVVRRADGLYATHTRDRDHHAIDAIDEAIRTAEASEVRLQISHLLPRMIGDGVPERAVEAVERAASRGLDIAFDMHTRLFGTTYLNTILPNWALEGGREALAAHLRSPDSRARMRDYRSIVAGGGWERVVLLDNPAFPEFSRRNLGEVGRSLGRDPHDVAFDILLAEIDQLHRPMVIILCYTEDDQARIFRHPKCMPGSDATTMAPDGPLARSVFHGAYSWAAWFYSFMVRRRRVLSPEEAIHRLTGLPARTLRLDDRGVLRRGAHADVAVFDPEQFGERGTTFEPNQLAQGMHHVVVNGVVTLRAGEPTGRRAGRVIRRAGPRMAI